MRRLTTCLISISMLAALAACGSSGKSILSTGSLIGGQKPAVAAVPADPMARPVQVGWVSARASRCGFYFDPTKLRATYLAHEAQSGVPVDQLRKYELTYDYAQKSTALKIKDEADYCSDERAAEIRKDLQRHLAGDFSPSPKKPKPKEKPLFSWGDPASIEPFNREKALNPRNF